MSEGAGSGSGFYGYGLLFTPPPIQGLRRGGCELMLGLIAWGCLQWQYDRRCNVCVHGDTCGPRMRGQIINHGGMEGRMMDGGDILSHFPRTVAWTSRTPSQCTCFSVCSSHNHTCAWTVHGFPGTLRLSRIEAVI